jgi:pimeloyl-ACP methyl ester carboxylesterase
MLGNFKSKKEVYKKIILDVDLVLAESLGSLNSGLDIIQKSNYDNFFVEEQSLNLYIYGEGDSITPPEIKNTIKIFDSVSVIKVISSSSHIPFLTNSDDFYKILKEFI